MPSGAAARRDARRLVARLDDGKAVVLLFRNESADSEHNASVVRGIDHRGGRVVTRVTSITQVGNYAIFTSKTTREPGADDLRHRAQASRARSSSATPASARSTRQSATCSARAAVATASARAAASALTHRNPLERIDVPEYPV